MCERYKYPRTLHLPWSPGKGRGDLVLADTHHFEGKEVVITHKLDGENATIYGDGYCHARSLDTGYHRSRDWIKNFASIKYLTIPNGWRLCGENLRAVHTIFYGELPSYFMAFSMWNTDNWCIDWDTFVGGCHTEGISTVPVIYKGKWDETLIKNIVPTPIYGGRYSEGYVVRATNRFPYDEFNLNVAKFVRENHVSDNTTHWTARTFETNRLEESNKG